MENNEVLRRVYNRERLNQAWQRVKENAGSAGIDEMTVGEFEAREEWYLERIHRKLTTGKYRFKPSKRVEIDKPGSTKRRKLGIPTVIDRIVGQSMSSVLMEIWEPEFTQWNYGYRPGRNQHQAIGHMRDVISAGYEWCVEIDLQNFFDRIPHNLILKLIRRKIKDERMITLIARALKAGTIVDGKYQPTPKGTAQGSPVSPVISNIVLNELDQELERRGHQYCRWADDVVIFVKSERSGKRVEEGITKYIEEIGLKVNREKSRVCKFKEVEFLGFQILNKKIKIGSKSRKKMKQKVKELTKRNNPLSMKQIVEELNEYLTGWMGYFQVQEYKRVLEELDWYTRSRLRSMQLKKWKKPRKFQRVMIILGHDVKKSRRTWVKMNKWYSVHRADVKLVLTNKWFRKLGLVFLSDYINRNLELPFSGQSKSGLPGRYAPFCWEGVAL